MVQYASDQGLFPQLPGLRVLCRVHTDSQGRGGLRHRENSESCLDLEKLFKQGRGRETEQPRNQSWSTQLTCSIISAMSRTKHVSSELRSPGNSPSIYCQPGYTSGLSGTFAKHNKPTENITLEENCIDLVFQQKQEL